MIPLTLEIKNFLSYGEQIQTIEFGHHALICLSGKNGNGKSALLDAMTWALWGQARKITGVTKADDGLLRLGAKRMMVVLTFIFSGKTYRIRREYERSYGKPLAVLDFEFFNDTSQRFHSLTDKTIRATQEKIDSLLGLDFETFSNSAFLRQGQSNEFSKKTPRERKHIIASILGLEKYDLLHQQALAHVKNFTEKQRLVSAQLTLQQEKLAQEDLFREQSQQQITVIKELKDFLHKHNQSLIEQEKEQARILQKKQEYTRLSELWQELTISIDKKKNVFSDLVSQWRTSHHKLIKTIDYAQFKREREHLLIQERAQLTQQQENLALQTTLLHLKQQHQEQKNCISEEIKKQLYSFQSELTKNEILLNKCQHDYQTEEKKEQELTAHMLILSQEKRALQQTLDQRGLFEIQHEEQRLQFEKRKIAYQSLINQGKHWNQVYKELEHKKKVILDQDNPSCPLCESLLTQKRKRVLLTQCEEDEHFVTKRIVKLTAIVKKLKQICIDQHAHLEEQNKKLKLLNLQAEQCQIITGQQENITSQLATIQKKKLFVKEQIHEQEHLVNTLKQAIAVAEREQSTKLATHPILIELDNHLADCEKNMRKHAYDRNAHESIQNNIRTLDLVLSQEQDRDQRMLVQEQLKQKITVAKIPLKQELQQLAHTQIQRNQLLPFITQQETLFQVIEQLKKDIGVKTLELEIQVKKAHHLEYEIVLLESVKKSHKENQQLQALYHQEIDEYQELALAFGKNGIQAILIEEAMPEIEREANRILGRLTENQSQIFIESLRDLKSGKVKETLDIHIADAVGIRPYEMFSGGEAFRIDFSLRIAIAKLLARRAGTALQTLIIDEGFGSQDEEGLRSIMQALYAIQDDFAKIIIVSHLNEFKENFPVHFIIEKNSTGSYVRVEERG